MGAPPYIHRDSRRGRALAKSETTRQFILRSFIADTVALISFFTVTGIINERYIARMTWDQVFDARILGAILMVPSGRPYGLWRDWFMRHAVETRRSQILWDALSLVSFQVPIYVAILAVSGAGADEILRGSLGVIVIMLALGRPYGAYLGLVRRSFGLPPGAQKTMSLNVK